MKALFTFLILLSFLFGIAFPISVFAQKIHFTDTTNVWKIVFVFVGDGIPEYSWYENYYVGTDIVNGKTYRNFSGIGYVREDTVTNKVYIIDPSTDSEKVLMDYNLAIGDTFRYNSFVHVVDSLDSTLINGIWYKVWHFSPIGEGSGWDYHVIEGVGCIEHPSFIISPFEPEAYWDVYCFSNQGITPPLSPPVMILDNTTSCTLPTMFSKEIKSISRGVNIYPNPVGNELTIKTSETQPYAVFMLNVFGQTVKTWHSDKQKETINISNLPDGIYNVRINYENGIQENNKIVIVH